ncbi:substrate-binding domain-containing protein [Streptomyces monticola]|uniref:Substrate-binding domain-containing protein n=1 Tax=Streptomyces monticola TaxID=2666263 RepID=A0ABW2JE62_9ACTN
MREPGELRRQRILAAVQTRGEVRLSDLSAELDVSAVTMRRDVEQLTLDGKVRRGHGVVRPVDQVRERAVPDGTATDGDPVALVVPERHTYLYDTLHGARIALEEAGMRVALHIAPQVKGAELPLVERALAAGARGLIIAPRWRTAATEEADYDWLARLDVPTVLMERRPRRGGALHAVDSVCTDHWYGTHLAVEHLVSLGHRRIVLAARDDSPTGRTIRAAFAEIAAARAEVEDWTVALSAHGAPGGAPLDLAALLRERRATGAVLHADVDALMMVQELRQGGVRVPQDCSVVAYDDVLAALGSPPLTAVAPPRAEIGRAAAELLLRRLTASASRHAAEPAPVRRVELLPCLKVRGSARPLKPASPEAAPAASPAPPEEP